MWLQLSNGKQELIHNEDHITRHMSEGAFEIPDPRGIASNEEEVIPAIGDEPARPKRGRKPKTEASPSAEALSDTDTISEEEEPSAVTGTLE